MWDRLTGSPRKVRWPCEPLSILMGEDHSCLPRRKVRWPYEPLCILMEKIFLSSSLKGHMTLWTIMHIDVEDHSYLPHWKVRGPCEPLCILMEKIILIFLSERSEDLVNHYAYWWRRSFLSFFLKGQMTLWTIMHIDGEDHSYLPLWKVRGPCKPLCILMTKLVLSYSLLLWC